MAEQQRGIRDQDNRQGHWKVRAGLIAFALLISSLNASAADNGEIRFSLQEQKAFDDLQANEIMEIRSFAKVMGKILAMQNGCSNLSVSALPISQMAADVEVVIRDSSDVFQHVQQSDEFASAIEQIISRFYLTANATADSCAESDLAQLRTDVRQYSGLMSDAATGLLALETTALLRQK